MKYKKMTPQHFVILLIVWIIQLAYGQKEGEHDLCYYYGIISSSSATTKLMKNKIPL